MDLNGDGHLDILTGSWPGELFFFRGGKDRTFAAPEMIKDKDGKYINIGGGITDAPDGGMLITGNAEFEKTPEGTFVNYHGKRLNWTAEKPISITGTASAVHATDWDGDGDHDLIVGYIGGEVYLIPNEGTPKAYAFGKEQQLQAKGRPLSVDSDAGPFTADWDGDGDLDLLVGAGDGSVSLFRNVGDGKTPKLAAASRLVSPGSVDYGKDAPKVPRRGSRSKVCAADWNGDGRLDLLVGDYGTMKPDLPEPTPEEKAEHEKIRKELKPLDKRFGELIDDLYTPSRVLSKEKREKLEKEFEELREQMEELRSKLPPVYESHGWVWLFLRKPATEKRGSY